MVKNYCFKKRNNKNCSIEYFINHMEQKLVFYVCFYQCFVFLCFDRNDFIVTGI